MHYLIEVFIGLSGGIAVGGAYASILTVLDILPRLAQISKSPANINKFESALVFGGVSWTVIDFMDVTIPLGIWGMLIFGSFGGIFIGLLIAGLAEVFNVLPVMSNRLKMNQYIFHFVVALILGKVTGSLFYWFVYIYI